MFVCGQLHTAVSRIREPKQLIITGFDNQTSSELMPAYPVHLQNFVKKATTGEFSCTNYILDCFYFKT